MNVIRLVPTVFKERVLPFVTRPVVLIVALAALALLAAAYLVRYFKWKVSQINTGGIVPRNPFYMAPGHLQPGGNEGWENLPHGVNHLIMARADLASVGSLQRTSRKFRQLFQFELFFASALFNKSLIKRQIYVVPLGDNTIRFSRTRAHESFIRLGFEAAGFHPNGRQPSPEEVQTGVALVSMLFNRLFDTHYNSLLAVERQRVDERGWSPARQIARYHLDLKLWNYISKSAMCQHRRIFPLKSLEDALVSVLLNQMVGIPKAYRAFTKIIHLSERQDWTRERCVDWNSLNDENDPENIYTRVDSHEDLNISPLSFLRSYLVQFGSFYSIEKPNCLKYEPSSEILLCSLVAANALRYLDYMQSAMYEKVIAQYEEKLTRDDDTDWAPLCQHCRTAAAKKLRKEPAPEAFLDHRKMVRLLTRPFAPS